MSRIGSAAGLVRRHRFSGLLVAIALSATPHVLTAATNSPHLVWSQNGNTTPRYSTWGGSAWSSASGSVNVNGTTAWIAGGCTPNGEFIGLITSDYNLDLNFYGRNGTTWTSAQELTGNSGGTDARCFDIAFEQASGDALIVYWDHDDSRLRYRTMVSYSLSGESNVSTTHSAQVKWVRLRSNPLSNEIVCVWMHSDRRIYAKVWNGSSWGNELAVTTNANDASRECFDAAYETLSGRAIAAHCDDNDNSPRYYIWNGSSWSGESTMSSVGAHGDYVRLAPSPVSNAMICAVQDVDYDLNAQYWNGSSWSSVSELETSLNRNNMRQFDVAYEYGGTEALIAYASDWSNNFRYRTWSGSAWSSESSDVSVGSVQAVIQLLRGATTGEVFLQLYTDSNQVRACHWNGSSFDANQTLETNGLGWGYEPFQAVIPAPVVVPANIPYSTNFQSTVGPEWNNTTTSTATAFTKFLGRFNSGSAKLALNTTIGETYTLQFDFYAIDSWDGDDLTWGPDYFNVTIGGTQMFHQTFSNRPSTYAPSYENPPVTTGELGFENGSTDADGIFNVTVSFTAATSVTTIEFADSGLQDIDDESWGIDNVSVVVSRFRDVSSTKSFAVQPSTSDTYGAGLHWGDFDNDGDLDAIVGGNSTSRYMRNNSQGSSFTASTFGSGSDRRQGAPLDIDNDGDLDFWSSNRNSYDVEACYQNNGSATFSNLGALGFDAPTGNEGCAAADLDRDGWCDLVMFSEDANWVGEHQGDPGGSTVQLVASKDSGMGLAGSGDSGNGDYCSSGDFNNDGYLDFFFHYNGGRLFCSTGSMTFTRRSLGLSVTTGNSDKFGSAWGDYDNDGDLDLFAARYASGSTGKLWRNDVTWTSTPTGTFTDRTTSAYVIDKSGQRGCAWGDYDNDGDLDLYVVARDAPNRLYQNQNDGTFRLVDEGANATGDGHDAVFVDYDNDGDLDIAYSREDSTCVLLENRTNDTNYLKVRLVGAGSGATNKAAIGVRVELWNSAGTVRLGRRDAGVARGFGGTEPMWLHFGGVNPASTYKLKVYWHSLNNNSPQEISVVPNSVSTTIGAVTIPRMITITEDSPRRRIIQWREVPNRV